MSVPAPGFTPEQVERLSKLVGLLRRELDLTFVRHGQIIINLADDRFESFEAKVFRKVRSASALTRTG